MPIVFLGGGRGGKDKGSHFQVGLSVEIGRRDETFALVVGGGEQHQIAREAVVLLDAEDVAHLDVLGTNFL